MSTRANIIIKDKTDKLYFYRHSDGYPSCTGEDLKEFVQGYKTSLRTDLGQSAGWLIVRGHMEYLEGAFTGKPSPSKGMYTWKVGAYEPTTCIHGDIEYLYTIDLDTRKLTCEDVYSKNIEFTEEF